MLFHFQKQFAFQNQKMIIGGWNFQKLKKRQIQLGINSEGNKYFL